jgi:uncharacterized coiled-coil protein SlyX
MTQAGEEKGLEHRIRELKSWIDTHARTAAEPTSEVVADLTKAVQEIGDHLVDLHRRIERIERSNPEWTTRGWMPPPGSDSPPDR